MPSTDRFTSIHGVLVDLHDVGVLLIGEPGIGKSSCALQLVIRGHRLVADDVVLVRVASENVLIGQSPETIRDLLAIPDLGILNVREIYGQNAVREWKEIDFVVELVSDSKLEKAFDAVDIMGVTLPRIRKKRPTNFDRERLENMCELS